jgi:CRP-like cAMP-binding protein
VPGNSTDDQGFEGIASSSSLLILRCGCNAFHLIEPRFCRWLLQSADRAASNTVTLTQELLAEMLGVRRTSVTEVASRVQSSGAISYSRGVIKILDRPALESLACECYQTLLDQQAELA